MNDRTKIICAMKDPDNMVLEMSYQSKKNKLTKRVVSPIRFVGNEKFMALCLCRQSPRVFNISKCSSIEIRSAINYVMPVPIEDENETDQNRNNPN